MKTATITLPVPNSLLILRSSPDASLPEVTKGVCFWANKSCITLSCLPDFEGEAAITIGPAPNLRRKDKPLFESEIETPSRMLLLQIVPGKTILECQVENSVTRVQIWTDGRPDTEQVTIAVE